MIRRTMTVAGVTIAVAAAVAAFTLGGTAAQEQGAAPPKVRVGTYESRAVAVAYGASKHNPVREKMQEMEKARAAGDRKRMADLESWGQKHQRQLHRQGFGRVPVDDLLAPVKDRLPEAARAGGVDVIAFSCEYAGPGVEVVDVTLAVVNLFEPSERTLKTIGELMGKEPLDLDTIEAHEKD